MVEPGASTLSLIIKLGLLGYYTSVFFRISVNDFYSLGEYYVRARLRSAAEKLFFVSWDNAWFAISDDAIK